MDLVLAYALIVLGGLLLAAELVLFTHGVLAMIGLGALIVGAVFIFGRDPTLGVATVLALVVVLPILGKMFVNYLPRTPLGRRMTLGGPQEGATVAHLPGVKDLEQLRGRYGKTVSPLRPSGATDFDG